jgi:hypothetical protein
VDGWRTGNSFLFISSFLLKRYFLVGKPIEQIGAACSLGLSATSQQYFSLRTNQPPATSQQ